MTADTEALRAKFESQFQALDLSRNEAGVYTDELAYVAFLAYRKGHAAAKAETAAAVAAERERIADLAADLAADACVEYANGRPMDFRTMVGDAIRAGAKEAKDA